MKRWIDSRLLGIAAAVVLPGAIAYACMQSLYTCDNGACIDVEEFCILCEAGQEGSQLDCWFCCAVFNPHSEEDRDDCMSNHCSFG